MDYDFVIVCGGCTRCVSRFADKNMDAGDLKMFEVVCDYTNDTVERILDCQFSSFRRYKKPLALILFAVPVVSLALCILYFPGESLSGFIVIFILYIGLGIFALNRESLRRKILRKVFIPSGSDRHIRMFIDKSKIIVQEKHGEEYDETREYPLFPGGVVRVRGWERQNGRLVVSASAEAPNLEYLTAYIRSDDPSKNRKTLRQLFISKEDVIQGDLPALKTFLRQYLL
jgi:hypothetical protein